jgi:hypothetical protein
MGVETVELDCRHAIVQRVRDRLDELSERIVSAIVGELPEYSRGRSAADLDDIAGGIRGSIVLCLQIVEEDRGLHEAERVVLLLTGGQRARQGIPRASVLQSVRIATREGRKFFLTCFEDSAEPHELTTAYRDISCAIDRFEDEAVAALGRGYDEAMEAILTGADRGEALLVDRLLERRFTDAEEVLRPASDVGLVPLREGLVVVVAPIPGLDGVDDEKDLRAAADDMRRRTGLVVGPFRMGRTPHLPLIVQPRGRDGVTGLVATLGRVGRERGVIFVYGDRTVPLAEIAREYQPLRNDLRFLDAATRRAGAIPALLPRFHRVICTGDASDRMALIGDVLGPLYDLPERERTELFEVVDTLYEVGGSAATLASHLHTHKNTVLNRLRRVCELTGLDLRQPSTRLVLDAVLRMRCVFEGDKGSDPVPGVRAERTG